MKVTVLRYVLRILKKPLEVLPVYFYRECVVS